MNVYGFYNDNFAAYFIVAANSEDGAKSVLIEQVKKKDEYYNPRDLEYIIPEINTESTIKQVKNTSCDLQEPTVLLTIPLDE